MALLQVLLLGTETAGFDEHAEDLAAAVEALAELLSLVAAAAATAEQQQQQQQQQEKGKKEAGGSSDAAAAAEAASLAAAVHLEALHTLLLLFPQGPGRLWEQLLLLAGPEGEAEGAALSGGHPGTAPAWPGLARRGLHALVVGRAPMVQRHAGLRLAAAVAEMLGPAWLAGKGLAGSAPGAFFQAVVEVVKVRDGLGRISCQGFVAPSWEEEVIVILVVEEQIGHWGGRAGNGGESRRDGSGHGAEGSWEVMKEGRGGGEGAQMTLMDVLRSWQCCGVPPPPPPPPPSSRLRLLSSCTMPSSPPAPFHPRQNGRRPPRSMSRCRRRSLRRPRIRSAKKIARRRAMPARMRWTLTTAGVAAERLGRGRRR